MTEQELRALVRDAIARHTAAGSHGPRPAAVGAAMPQGGRVFLDTPSGHASHALFVLPVGMDSDGPCIIEPAVTCNHCGYCKSYGH